MKKNGVVIIRDETTNELKFYLETVEVAQQKTKRRKMATELTVERVGFDKQEKNYDTNIRIYLLGKYIEFVIEDTKKFLKSKGFDDLTFSLNVAKFQKLITISFCRFLKTQNKEFKLINSLNDNLSVINVSCGFSIDYDFSAFLLPSFSNEDNCDKSLGEIGIIYEDYRFFLKEVLKKSFGFNSLAMFMLPEELKEEVNKTIFDYILYNPKTIGNMMNKFKPEELENNKKISFRELSLMMDL